MEVSIKDLKEIYEKEISKNVKNRQKILEFEKNKFFYLTYIKNVLKQNTYDGGKYFVFLIYYPKLRVVMSQNIYNKIINHYIARKVIIPKFDSCLSERNCATRINKGGTYAIKLLKKDIEKMKKYQNFYFLKLDIKKFFYSIDHQVLLNLLKPKLNEEEIEIVKKILDSTNKDYINKQIVNYEAKINKELPKYYKDKGLPIGNMTSQFFAVFYLYKLQHFMTNNLHLKFINYMDDYIIMHQSKTYLISCLNVIEEKLITEYKLTINRSKTKITSAKEGVNFLGYNIKVINNKTIIRLSNNSKKNIKKGIKKALYSYDKSLTEFSSLFSSLQTYRYLYPFVSRYKINNIINRYI